MIEDVIDVRAQLSSYALSEVEILVDAEIHAPSSRPPQHVTLGDTSLRENIRANGGETECTGVPDHVAAFLIEVVAQHHGTEGRLGIEVTDCIQGANPNVPGLDRAAVIADPKRCKTRSGFCEHIECGLPAAYYGVGPPGHGCAVLAASADR